MMAYNHSIVFYGESPDQVREDLLKRMRIFDLGLIYLWLIRTSVEEIRIVDVYQKSQTI